MTSSTYVACNDVVKGDIAPEAMASDRAAARIENLEKLAWRAGTVVTRDLAGHSPINYVHALIGVR